NLYKNIIKMASVNSSKNKDTIRSNTLRTILLFFICLGITLPVLSQEKDAQSGPPPATGSPIDLEPFIGTDGTLIAMNYSKPLEPESKFGVFMLAEYYGVYKRKSRQQRENQY